MRIIAYMVIEENDSYRQKDDLTERVNEAIRDGWQPLGGAIYSSGDARSQTMVKYGEAPSDAPASIEDGAANIIVTERVEKRLQYLEATRLAEEFVQLMQRMNIKPAPLRKCVGRRTVGIDGTENVTEPTPYVGWILWPGSYAVITVDGQIRDLDCRDANVLNEQSHVPMELHRPSTWHKIAARYLAPNG